MRIPFVDVVSGIWLQVAQRQSVGDWLWGALLLAGVQRQAQPSSPTDLLRSYLSAFRRLLGHIWASRAL
jgi:hypothetical protein